MAKTEAKDEIRATVYFDRKTHKRMWELADDIADERRKAGTKGPKVTLSLVIIEACEALLASRKPKRKAA